jgi:hypothetical protein
MIEDRFDARTLANMQVALERVCRRGRTASTTRFAGALPSGLCSAQRGVREPWVHLQKPVNVPCGSAHYRFCPALKIPEIASTLRRLLAAINEADLR